MINMRLNKMKKKKNTWRTTKGNNSKKRKEMFINIVST